MKQGAVDFLISHLQKSKDWQRVLNEVSQMSTSKFDLIKEAKEKFEQQAFEFWNGGIKSTEEGGKSFDQYYNENFKSE
jgi:hypothetical protein